MSQQVEVIDDYELYVPAPAESQAPGLRRRGSTPRTHELAWDATRRSGIFVEEAELNESYVPPEGDLSPILADAHRFAWVYPRLTPLVRDGELIVGAKIQSDEEPSWGWVPVGSAHYVPLLAELAPPDRPDIRSMADRGLLSPAGSLAHKVVDYAGYIRTGSDTSISSAVARNPNPSSGASSRTSMS